MACEHSSTGLNKMCRLMLTPFTQHGRAQQGTREQHSRVFTRLRLDVVDRFPPAVLAAFAELVRSSARDACRPIAVETKSLSVRQGAFAPSAQCVSRCLSISSRITSRTQWSGNDAMWSIRMSCTKATVAGNGSSFPLPGRTEPRKLGEAQQSWCVLEVHETGTTGCSLD